MMPLSTNAFLPSPILPSVRYHAIPRFTTSHRCRNHINLPARHILASSLQSPIPEPGAPIPSSLTSSTSLKALPHPITFLIGLASSTLGSLIGAGGGVVLTPILTALGRPQHVAHGTSLCVITITALISSLNYARRGQMHPIAAITLTVAAIVTAPYGARQSANLNAKALKRIFGTFLILVSILVPLLPRVFAASTARNASPLLQRTVLIAVGAVTGFLSGLLGIGGGTINVPTLVLVAGFSQKVAQGTALLAMIIPTARASQAHLKLQHVALPLLPGLIAGAVAGGFLGANIALNVPEVTLRLICSFIFACIGLRYLFAR